VKVVLLKDVEKLGRVGEIKDVADGFARNFLIPQNLAKPATQQAIQEIEMKQAKKAKSAQMELEETQKIAEQLEGRELFIKVKEKDGILFGSVNEKTIAKAFTEEGLNIQASNIKLEEPIKEIGDYDVHISLDHGLEANIKAILVPEETQK